MYWRIDSTLRALEKLPARGIRDKISKSVNTVWTVILGYLFLYHEV